MNRRETIEFTTCLSVTILLTLVSFVLLGIVVMADNGISLNIVPDNYIPPHLPYPEPQRTTMIIIAVACAILAVCSAGIGSLLLSRHKEKSKDDAIVVEACSA